MCQYLCEIQTVGTHDNLIPSGVLIRSANFCGTGVRILAYSAAVAVKIFLIPELCKGTFSNLQKSSQYHVLYNV